MIIQKLILLLFLLPQIALILMIQILSLIIIQIISFTHMILEIPMSLSLSHFQMNLILMKQIRMIILQMVLILMISKQMNKNLIKKIKKMRTLGVLIKPVMTSLGQMKQYLKSVIKIINVNQMLDIIISKKIMNIQFILILSN